MSNDDEQNKPDNDERDKARTALKKLSQKKPRTRAPRKIDNEILRRADFIGRAVWIYVVVGFLVTLGWFYVSSSDSSPGWLSGTLSFFGIALRIVFLIGVIALGVWLFRSTRRPPDAVQPVDDGRFPFDFREKPVQSIVFLLTFVLLLVIGPIGILYYFLIPTTFTPSVALRGFSNAMLIAVAVIGFSFGVFFYRRERGKLGDKDAKPGDKFVVLFMPVLCPALLALCWLFFAAGPLSYTLHLFAEKETKTIVERNVKGGTAGSADFMCGGFWTAELHDHSFWWPRRVCNIDLKTKNALDKGGEIVLRGKVSRFGIDIDSYGVR